MPRQFVLFVSASGFVSDGVLVCAGGVLASPVLLLVVCFTSVIVSGGGPVCAGGILASPVRLFCCLFLVMFCFVRLVASVFVSGGDLVLFWWRSCLASSCICCLFHVCDRFRYCPSLCWWHSCLASSFVCCSIHFCDRFRWSCFMLVASLPRLVRLFVVLFTSVIVSVVVLFHVGGILASPSSFVCCLFHICCCFR